jgi:hypothetical protein
MTAVTLDHLLSLGLRSERGRLERVFAGRAEITGLGILDFDVDGRERVYLLLCSGLLSDEQLADFTERCHQRADELAEVARFASIGEQVRAAAGDERMGRVLEGIAPGLSCRCSPEVAAALTASGMLLMLADAMAILPVEVRRQVDGLRLYF